VFAFIENMRRIFRPFRFHIKKKPTRDFFIVIERVIKKYIWQDKNTKLCKKEEVLCRKYNHVQKAWPPPGGRYSR
jgi:hypothetical protein